MDEESCRTKPPLVVKPSGGSFELNGCAVQREYPVKAGEPHPRLRHQRSRARDEIKRVPSGHSGA
jgi:hypothetical protein